MDSQVEQIELKPCPFCGGEASVSTYETESLWSHNQVVCTKVSCEACDIAFQSEPGYETEAPAAWNTRASLALPKVESETWQPIETAPKDGACILVWADGFEWPEIIRWYFYDPDIAEEEGVDGYWHYAEESMHDHFDWEHEVTHWRPLPAEPSTLNTGGTHE